MHGECFHDQLAFAAGLFVVDDRATATHGQAALADPAALGDLLAAHGAANDAQDSRAVASQWSKWVFARLIIPSVVLQCSLNRRIDFKAHPAGFDIDTDGTPTRFVFAAPPLGAPGTGHDFSSLIDDALAPVIAALCRGPGLSPRVYGSNAAMYYCWALEQLTAQERGVDTTRAAALALTETPHRPDGGSNPFHAPFKALAPGARDGQGMPATECRRLCCVRDLDAAWGLCSNCPRVIAYDSAPAAATG